MADTTSLTDTESETNSPKADEAPQRHRTEPIPGTLTTVSGYPKKLKIYKLDNGQYPTTEQGLNALVEPPAVGALAKKWRTGGYLEKGRVPKDPWDNDFVYISPGLHGDFDLISYGPDNQSGGEGNDADVNNWELQ